MKKLNKHFERSAMEHPALTHGIVASAPPAAGIFSAGLSADRPSGHRHDPTRREDGYGVVTTVLHPPVKGTFDSNPASRSRIPGSTFDSGFSRTRGSDSFSYSDKLPKLHFPTFDGEHSQLWISRAENNFDMYHVDSSRWIMLAAYHCTDAAARWIQSIEKRLKNLDWSEICKAVHDRFGRDQQETLLRQLFHIRQTTTVADYVERFSSLVDQLVAYDSPPDALYFTTRFIDGLREDIKPSVAVQRPSTFDTACSLALLQDELAEPARRRDFRRSDGGFRSKSAPKGPHPLPAPPNSDKKTITTAPPAGNSVGPTVGHSVEDRLVALRAYRRAKGLCDKCAEKWSRDHRCAATVQLHAMQEVWELFHLEDTDTSSAADDTDDSQLCVAISMDALSGTSGPKTLQMHGMLGDTPV